jgi:integrase
MSGEGLSPATVRRVRAVLHAALADAVVDNLLAYNPAEAVGRRTRGADRAEHKKLRVWSRDQLCLFLDSAADDRLYALWHTLPATGLRRGEALGLKWECLDLAEGFLSVERTRVPVGGKVLEGKPKTETSCRRIKLGASTVVVLKRWEKQQKREHLMAGSAWHNTGYVFTNADGMPLDPRWVSRLFVRAVAAANAKARAEEAEDGDRQDEPEPDALPSLSIHGLRHTYATAALAAGISVKAVSSNLGHANIQITLDTYSHVLDDMRDEAAEAVDDFMFAARA